MHLRSPTSRFVLIERKASAMIVVVTIVAGCGSSGGAVAQQSSLEKGQLPERHLVRRPAPISGVPLTTDSGLNLLVASPPPFVLDVDDERTAPLPGVSSSGHAVIWTVGIGGKAAVVAVGGIADMDTRLYGVRNLGVAVSDLGTGNVVWSSNDGRAAWVQRGVAESGCTLHKVGLEGQVLRAPRAFPCARAYDPNGGALGLVVNGTRIIDPNTGREVLKVPLDIIAGTGKRLVLGRWGRRETQLTLLDAATRTQRRIPWPSTLPSLDRPAVDPKGRFIAPSSARRSSTGCTNAECPTRNTATRGSRRRRSQAGFPKECCALRGTMSRKSAGPGPTWSVLSANI